MHLLLARQGTVAEGGEAVDLGQTPAELLVLSAADTEIAALAGAAGRLDDAAPTLRLANLLKLSHPMSVDAWCERTARHARLVVVRLLGGESYWPYGLERLLELAQRPGGPRLVALPGDDKPDPGLDRYATIPPGERDRLWRYLIEGGAENADRFLLACRAVLDGGDWPAEARPLLRAGVLTWRPGGSEGASASRLPASSPAGTSLGWGEERGATVAIVVYRALVQSGQTGPVEALARALRETGLDPLPVYVASLKDPVSVATLRTIFAGQPPAVVINLTGFAVSSPGGAHAPTVLDETGAVVLQAVLASGGEDAWAASSQGLSARDLAMSVALPEVDGRVMTRAIAFKSAGEWDERTQTLVVAHKPVADRLRFVASLAAAWVRLRNAPPAERRVAILLANYPNRDGRIANGVGLDTPAGTVEVLRALAAAGYDTGSVPVDGNALVEHLLAGPTNAGIAGRQVRETLPLDAYRAFFEALPSAVRDAVNARWGAPEADPFVLNDCRAFALPVARFGNVLVGIQPARGYNIDPKETYHSPDLVPPHNYLALYAFLRHGAGVHAIVHMGKHGNLEWLPGKALALSEACYPEAVLGPLPHLYPFIVNDPGEGTQAKRRTSAVIIDHLTPPLTRAETYGPLRDLEVLLDEYYAANGDPRRLTLLKRDILDLVRSAGLDRDLGIDATLAVDDTLEALDAYLCELKELQIRDGLHVFGVAPQGRLLTDLVTALARLPRGPEPQDASLIRSLAADLFAAPSEPPRASPASPNLHAPTSANGRPSSPLGGEGAERSGLNEGKPGDGAAAAHPPLSCRTSPLQGGRSAGTNADARSDTPQGPADGSGEASSPQRRVISPLEGEMAGKPEGGGTAHSPNSAARDQGSSPASPAETFPRAGEDRSVVAFDPLDCAMAEPWTGPRPQLLHSLSTDPWRTTGDTVERLELLAAGLVAGEIAADIHWLSTTAVLAEVEARLKPAVTASGPAEIAGLLAGLDGRFVPPGPSGAPSRGRPDVLPTGRNFFSVDTRAVPTETAWRLGKKSAELLVTRHLQDHGDYPRAIGLTAWGTANMRTGGDDLAQAFALIGAKPAWDRASRRVTGFEITTLAELGRPRVDVTLRISGFFRDAFPEQIALFDRAVRAVGALDEDEADNPIAARMAAERQALVDAGASPADADRRAGFRVFGSMPGAYGAGLQALIDERGWETKDDLAAAYLAWGGYAYGADAEGEAERDLFAARLSELEAVVQNQDNREHDLLDSDDYYQFEGGMTAAVETLSGARPAIYHNDHSRPERPVIRTLEEEISRVVRARVVNPKWIAGVMRHGYKGGFEIAATVDYMFAFAATTGAVRDHHFDLAFAAFIGDEAVRGFMADNNPAALAELAERFEEAIARGLWHPRANSVPHDLAALRAAEETP
ncbi:cobaltochelatase subunit CobN [Mangrovibrevibacter kandeliae]|uniref:cobaltochelatase subunit CobN n=1 Tax=Mangrovibrevibacter kandeliae TaxID=2968473 RepID=UPI002118DE0B|nr:cobaltochelatase subunit CobN [Aurantimonas sp. CSK15Z-1]MCQ8784340.1 cobaltochelatase subunit CobN [Aurantimonas sp. CSK15Z-1]